MTISNLFPTSNYHSLKSKFYFSQFSFCPAFYFINKLNVLLFAEVVKLVDALDSKSSILRGVWVQVPPSAQRENPFLIEGVFLWRLVQPE